MCGIFSKVGKKEGMLQSIPKGNVPFEIIHIDHYEPVDNGRTKKYQFVIIDDSLNMLGYTQRRQRT